MSTSVIHDNEFTNLRNPVSPHMSIQCRCAGFTQPRPVNWAVPVESEPLLSSKYLYFSVNARKVVDSSLRIHTLSLNVE